MVNIDIQFFWGGTDINSTLYGESRGIYTDQPDRNRDAEEVKLFEECVKSGIPMLGICRGSQLLNVLNGGKLRQDITGHINGNHLMTDLRSNVTLEVNSTHHQMMVPGPDAEIIGIAPFKIQAQINPLQNYYEVLEFGYEVIYYPKTKCLCVQWHPEWIREDSEAVVWLKELVKTKFNIDNITFKYNSHKHFGKI